MSYAFLPPLTSGFQAQQQHSKPVVGDHSTIIQNRPPPMHELTRKIFPIATRLSSKGRKSQGETASGS
jgi:hypothetical protein